MLGYRLFTSKVINCMFSLHSSWSSNTSNSSVEDMMLGWFFWSGNNCSTRNVANGANQELRKLQTGLEPTGSLWTFTKIRNIPAHEFWNRWSKYRLKLAVITCEWKKNSTKAKAPALLSLNWIWNISGVHCTYPCANCLRTWSWSHFLETIASPKPLSQSTTDTIAECLVSHWRALRSAHEKLLLKRWGSKLSRPSVSNRMNCAILWSGGGTHELCNLHLEGFKQSELAFWKKALKSNFRCKCCKPDFKCCTEVCFAVGMNLPPFAICCKT